MTIKTFLTNKFSLKKFRLNGLVPSSRLPHKRHLALSFRDHILYSPEQLPPKVDLRSDMTPVEDQSRIGSCSANTLAGAYEYLTKKANGRNTDVSRLFIYYNGRVKDQKTATVVDSGCTMTCAIEALEEFGTCLESIWPYDISRVNTRPNDQSYQEANRHKITEALRININLYEMKSCLAQGFPFAFGLRLYASFDQAATTGVVPMPNLGNNSRQSHGSHALLAVGYSDQSNAFIVRNSWGENWGDKGYCYIPYEYITNNQLCFDVWTVRKLATNDFGQAHWNEQDSTNYLQVSRHHSFDDDGGVIETYDENDDDDDYDRRDDYDNSSNQYPGYRGNNYSRNDDDDDRRDYYDKRWNQYRPHRGNNYSRNDEDDCRDDYQNPWNQYRNSRRNNYSRNDDDDDDDDRSEHSSRRDDYRNPSNRYQGYGGNYYSRDDDNRSREPFRGYPGGGNSSYSPYDQFLQERNFSNFRGGYSNFPSNPFPGYQSYGFNYGYASPFNNYFNPYFS